MIAQCHALPTRQAAGAALTAALLLTAGQPAAGQPRLGAVTPQDQR